MTIINVMVDDQRLEFSSMPVVASEGVKETYVKFALSSDWSGFGATALFYRDDSPEDVYTSVLDGAGLAEVPYEITAAPGWIRFGLSGSDGTSVHTSEILKYKVVKGKYTSGQSSEPPAPGIYEQMLAIAGQMRDTLNASVIEQNAIIQGLVSDMDDLRSDMETEQTTFESVVTGQINTLVNNFAGSSRETILFEGSDQTNIGGEIDLVSDPTVYDYLDIVLNDGLIGTIIGPTQNSQWRVTGETVKSTGASVTTYVIEGVLDAQSLCLRVSTACAIVDTGTASTRYDLVDGPLADESLRRYCLKVIGRKLTDDAEVLNIRVGADGVTYQTAGTAVRTQLDKKLNAPISGGTVDYGASGQLLATDGQGNTEWVDSVIPDGSITVAKLAPGVIDTTYQIQGAAASSVTVGQSLATKANAADVTSLDTRMTAVEGNVDDINDRLTNDYIPIDGENLVAPQNIQGVTFTKTTEEIAGDNIFSSDLLFEENYYVSINTSANPPVITHTSTSGYKAYCVPVDGVSKYTFTSARFACLAKGDTLGSEAVGTLQTYATSIVTTGANYLFLTYTSSTDFANIEIHKITEQDAYTDFEMPEWSGIPALQNRVYELQYLAGVNLFDHAELIKENGYAAISNGKITFANLSGYNAYLLPVDGKSIYTFTRCRFAFLVDSDKESAIGDLLQNISQIDSTGASYIAFSFNTSSYPLADYSVVGEIHINTNKLPFAVVTGDISSGGDLQLPSTRSNLRKGERVVFEGNITNFSTLIIGLTRFTSDFGNDTNRRNVFTVDDTNITYKAYPSATAVTVPHGLTISENIQIIWEMTATASCKITLISDGVLFSHEFTNFVRQVIGNPFVYSADSVLTGCKLTWICTDIDKDIWMFGDSYFAYAEARWTYYLHQYGYDNNCLLDGFPGEGSTNGRVAFYNLLQYGTPKMAVWCLGMNDGGDSDSAPSVNWVSARDSFLQYCQSNNVEPIFGTIPTVPSINHEQKNAWIRSSGYRYIDFAKAVGASASGVWFSGMLSSDNVHPTPQGARALFARVLLDLPEIMVDLRG